MYKLEQFQINNLLKLHKLEPEKPRHIRPFKSGNLYEFEDYVIYQFWGSNPKKIKFEIKPLPLE